MSGRRKLPQIPGQSSCPGGERVTTPQRNPESPRETVVDGSMNNDNSSSFTSTSCNGVDENSREPEGRSQNSSPATSLIRGHAVDGWREKSSSHWGEEELKTALRDLHSTRDQLLTLNNLVSTTLGLLKWFFKSIFSKPHNHFK